MSPQIPVIFILGPPGAGKSTLSARLTENFPVQHISVGNLLRRIKNDTTHPQAEALTSMLNKQELIDAKVLVPILRNELEKSESREQGMRVILMDGFPRNLAQRREFEEVVSMLASKLATVLWREADDEAMFEKRYQEYVQENEDIVREYGKRGLLVEVDTGNGTEESWEKLYHRLEKHIKWIDGIHS